LREILTQTIAGCESLTPHQVKSFWFAAATVLCMAALSMAAVAGGMKYFIIALAVAVALLVYRNPKEAASAGVLFLLACNVFFPSLARFDGSNLTEPWEMYSWATGLLIITVMAVARIGIRCLLCVPSSTKVFLLVAVVAGIVGFEKGGSLSYVSRQLYGSILLVVYFAIAYHIGDEKLSLCRMRTFGVLSAAIFFVYYAAVFGEHGFHKEMTTLATLEGMLAAVCVVTGLAERKLSWIVSGLVMLGVPFLLFARHAILSSVFAMVLALAMKTSTKRSILFFCAAAALLLIPSIFPAGAEFVMEKAMESGTVERILPAGTRDVTSLMDRSLELLASLDVLQRSPLIGDGFGNELVWDSPVRGTMAQAYVDNGWAYVAVKMGGLGLIAFGWFLFTVLRCVSRNALAISVSLIALVLLVQFSEPVFFQFTTSPLCGVLAGLLCAKRMKETGSVAADVSLSQTPNEALNFEGGAIRA
jgi:O-Antigen ligase